MNPDQDDLKKLCDRQEKLRFLASHVGTRILLSTQLGIPYDQVRIGIGHFGKKYCINSSELHFNISHSGDYVVLAFSRYSVGVDVERICSNHYYPEVLKLLSERTQQSYKESDDKLLTFFKIWTGLESFTKLEGIGLTGAINSFSIIPNKKYDICTISSLGNQLIGTYIYLNEKYLICVCQKENELFKMQEKTLSEITECISSCQIDG